MYSNVSQDRGIKSRDIVIHWMNFIFDELSFVDELSGRTRRRSLPWEWREIEDGKMIFFFGCVNSIIQR